MKRTRLIPVVLSTLLLFWTAFAAADNAKAIPKRIFIADIAMPKKPDIVGKGAITAALLGGPLGAFAADGANGGIENAYAQLLAKNGIDVGADIAFELKQQLSAKGYEVVSAPEQAEATLNVNIQNYGLAAIKGTDGSIPMFTPIFILKNSEGKRIWTKQVLWGLVKEIPKTVQAHPVPDYFDNPNLLVGEMHKFNGLVISTAFNKL